MIYSNISGTSKPSFKIGPKGVSLSSSAVFENIHAVKGFKKVNPNDIAPTKQSVQRLVVNQDALLYDCEIPINLVQNITANDDNSYTFELYDRNTGETREFKIQAGVGNSTVAFSGEVAVENNLAAFTDTTGNRIHDSGYSVYAGALGTEEAREKTDEVPTVSAVQQYVGELTDYLKQRLNGKHLSNKDNTNEGE